MVELHGWLTISETCRDEDLLSQAELDDIKQKVNEIIANCDSDRGMTFSTSICIGL